MKRLLPCLLIFGLTSCRPAFEAGPVGDGKADDTAALQAQIDKGGLIHLPPGTYRITKTLLVDLPKTGFTKIEGSTVARVVMAGPGPAFRFVGTHGGTAAPKSVKPEVWAKERMPGIEGVEIVGEHEEADAIEAQGTMKFTANNLLIRHCRHGIHLVVRNRNVIISDCHIYENHGIGVFLDQVNLHQINIVGSHISYNDDGGVVVKAGEVRNLQITGCDIEGNQGKNRPATANVLIDNTGGSNAEIAITGNTIQHNHEAPGSANIRFLGESKPVRNTDEKRDGHLTITGNILSDVKVNVHLQNARGVVITGNTFWTAYEHNLLCEGSSHVVIGANNFDRNPRYNGEEIPTTTNDIVFRDCSDATISGIHIRGVRAAPAAVTLDRCRRILLQGCSILDYEKVGLLLRDVTDSQISNCLIWDDVNPKGTKPVVQEGKSTNCVIKDLHKSE